MGFQSKNDYFNFSLLVTHAFRYALNDECRDFLQHVSDSVSTRVANIAKGSEFWRAQIGYDLQEDESDSDGVSFSIYPYSAERMKPRHEFASHGRANPKGIAALYLASDKVTAMSEVRPWLKAEVSCANFVITQDIKIVDCARYIGKNLFGVFAETEEEILEAVWADIDRAFSRPVSYADVETEYIPTQILSELFKSLGYDGVGYKSSVHDGYNLALFDMDHAKFVECQIFDTKRISYEFSEASGMFKR